VRVSSLRSPAKAGAVSRAAGEEHSKRPAFLEFFGLREQPFDQAPNPHYFYPSATHKEALASLLCGIESRRGFLGLIAEPGIGKTTLLYEVLQRLRTSSRTAFVPQGQIEPGDLLRSLLADLEVDDPGRGFFQMHQQLNEILIREANSGRHLVLVIDEAQDLERPVLEMVRILSNFETPRAKLMEIVMAGEPALLSKLAQPALVQLRQRISLVGRLNPLSDAETAEYIHHRLRVAGYFGGSLFTPEARALIAAQSEGVPREINTLCFNALSLGYSLGRRTIDVKIVEEVVTDLERVRSRVPSQAEAALSGGEQPAPQPPPQSSSPDRLVDAPQPIRAEEAEPALPVVVPSLFQRRAARTTASRARLAGVGVALSALLPLLFFAERQHKPMIVAPPAAVAPISHPAEPDKAVMSTKTSRKGQQTDESQSLDSSHRSLRAEAPPETASATSTKGEEGESGGARSSKLGTVQVEQSRPLASNPSPQSVAKPAVPSMGSKTLPVERHDLEVVSPAPPALVIDEAPPGAQVFVDGQLTASTDSRGQAKISTLAPGQHRLLLTLIGYQAYEQNIDLEAGNTFRVAARLDPSKLSSAVETAHGPNLPDTARTPPVTESTDVSVPGFVLDRTLKGHSGWVTGIAFSPNGLRLASSSWDQTVKLWDVATGQVLGNIAGEIKGVEALAFSDDGLWLAAETSSNTVALWDATTGREIRILPGNEPSGLLSRGNWVYSIAFSPDSRWLASGVDDKTVRLWEVKTGRVVRDLPGLRRSVIYIAFSPDGRWLASGGDGKTIEIWDLASGQEMRRLSGHKRDVYAVAFSPDSRWLASASGDKSVKLWDVLAGRAVYTLVGHRNSVTSLAFSSDGRWLASGSWDRTVKIWDVQTGREEQTLAGHTHRVYTIAVGGGGRWLASGSEDGTIKLWRLREPVGRSATR
jgi:WD40 repeat protein/type II secretory pathway predicted ATPase ExeA